MPESTDIQIQDWEDYRYELVPVNNLFVDKEYQRRLTGLAKEIALDFKPPLVGTLCVSARKEVGKGDERRVTSGAVFDGQTRMEGAKLRNEMIRKSEIDGKVVPVLPCIVYSGLKQQQEAQLFEWLQTRRRNAMSYDRFRAALVAGNEESLTINEIVEECGYEVGYTGMSDRTISAVSALEQMYRRDVVTMERALIIFKDAWKENYLPQAQHLRGMGRFLRDNPDVDDERLVRRMFLTSPTDLDKKEINARELSGGKRSDRTMADAIKSVYSMRQSQVDAGMKRRAA